MAQKPDQHDSTTGQRRWADAPKGKVHQDVFIAVQRIERNQFDLYQRFVRLAYLYDPNMDNRGIPDDRMGLAENVVASTVDTVSAAIAPTDVRARFMTDGADWKLRRTARHLEWYAEQIGTDLDVAVHCRTAFKDSAIKGTGIVKVWADRFDRIHVEPIPVDEIVVDTGEIRGGRARQLHHRMCNVVAEDLAAEYPEHRDAIMRARKTFSGTRLWAGYRPVDADVLVVVESWKLPIGKKGEKGYKAGRHTVCIDSLDLLDEAWDEDFLPFAKLAWSDRGNGWYGISIAERIAGHQAVINKSNWQIDKLIDRWAYPTQYVRPVDAHLAIKSHNRLGGIAVCRGDYPHTDQPQAVSAEVYQRNQRARESAFEETGVSRMAAQSYKPAGIESGVALREYRDQTTQRFALQEKAFERLVLDTIWLVLWCCKKLGDAAPTMMRHSRFGARKLRWKDVDLRDTKVQLQAASTLTRTPAGRMQTVIEYAQAGIITQDEARRLLQHPDLEAEISLYTAAEEVVEHALDEIADGRFISPEPYMNLKLTVWRAQREYLKWLIEGAPEDVQELLRTFIVQTAYMAGLVPDASANQNMSAQELPTAQPAAALAPQAMQLQAS